jgi:predicted acylesterase/phospholipase RssA
MGNHREKFIMDAEGPKSAVILSGGGAYGAYEVGVMNALLTGKSPSTGYRQLVPDIFSGTSVGAINAAVLVSQAGAGVPGPEGIKFLEDSWLNIVSDNPQTCGNGAYRIRADPFRYLNPRCLTNPEKSLRELAEDSVYLAESFLTRTVTFFNTSGPIETRALEFIDLSAFVSPEPIDHAVRGIISLEAIRRSPKALRIVAANWATGQPKVFENEDLTDELGYQAILASAAIPGFFPPQYMGGQPYVDGGLVMNTPLKYAIKAGGDFLHVIYLDPDIDKLPLKVLQNTYNTLDRTILINNAMVVNEDIATAAWINDGLDAIERASAGAPLTDQNVRNFIRVAGQIESRLKQGAPYRKLVLHRYHPHYDLGDGDIGILNFKRDRIARLIEQGLNDTVYHNCEENQCIVPK